MSELSNIEEVIEDARNGKMFILVDAEDRENEGDLIIPSQMATPDAINFMATHGRGLICLAMNNERGKILGLEMMARNNRARHQTAFTISIEAKEGISTGISVHDRARTISVAIDPKTTKEDIVSPGHVFPLIARNGGVLVRAGHTEAACDIARLAGLSPSGVICEIMSEDGTMARLPELKTFAKKHDLKIATIADLIAYRRRHDKIVSQVFEKSVKTGFGGSFNMKVYCNTAEYAEHLAFIKGDLSGDEPVLVRVHAVNILDDLLALSGNRESLVGKALEAIEEEGRGVLVLMRDTRSTIVSDRLKRLYPDAKCAPAPAPTKEDTAGEEDRRLIEYGVGAQILLDLGVKEMTLLSNNPNLNIVGLDGYGLRVVGQRSIT